MSNSAKHTPGPWAVDDGMYNPNPLIVAASEAGPLTVAEVLDDVYPDVAAQLANARLIAAAPEMLDLIRRQVGAMGDGPMSDMNYAGINWLKDAREVLAKAEGKR